MVGVLLVNNHVLFRNGLRRLLEDDAAISVVGEADTGEAALSFVARLAPQAVLMDLMLPGMGGLEATLRLRRQHPSIGVVIVTTQAHGSYPRRILAGAPQHVVTSELVAEHRDEPADPNALRGESTGDARP